MKRRQEVERQLVGLVDVVAVRQIVPRYSWDRCVVWLHIRVAFPKGKTRRENVNFVFARVVELEVASHSSETNDVAGCPFVCE